MMEEGQRTLSSFESVALAIFGYLPVLQLRKQTQTPPVQSRASDSTEDLALPFLLVRSRQATSRACICWLSVFASGRLSFRAGLL